MAQGGRERERGEERGREGERERDRQTDRQRQRQRQNRYRDREREREVLKYMYIPQDLSGHDETGSLGSDLHISSQ